MALLGGDSSHDHIFLRSTATGWNTFKASRQHGAKDVYVRQVSLSGVPVTAGVPNSLYYNLDIEGLDPSHWIKGDTSVGVPVRLTGSFTTQQEVNPVHLGSVKGNGLNNFRWKLTDPTGADAIYTEADLWLLATN